jgi:hypothetical protein
MSFGVERREEIKMKPFNSFAFFNWQAWFFFL